jgi:hypothetical protein
MHLAGAVMIAMAAGGPTLTLPDEIAGWRAKAPPSRYDAETIFKYIDGHGEVYLAYGMAACLARRYAGPGGEGDIVLDVFSMASTADAYGIFTHSREGEPAGVGQDGTFGYGTLLFWKGRHFVSVQAEEESDRAREAVMALGRAVAARIAEAGERPALVDRLPSHGLAPGSVVYLRHPQILDARVRLGPGNPLGLGPEAPAVVGRYLRDGAGAQLVLVDYPSASASTAASTAFAGLFLDGGAPARRDDGWYAAAPLAAPGHARAFVVRATSREAALALLADAEQGERR